MIDLQIGRFVDAFNGVASMAQIFAANPQQNIGLDKRGFEEFVKSVQTLVEICERCDLDVVAHWSRLALAEASLFKPDASNKYVLSADISSIFRGHVQRLKDSIIGQSHTRFALILDHKSKELWEPSKPAFGDDFKNKFQSCQYDLEEAGRSLALARSTATVFHLMRVMEAGLNAVHQCLGIQVQLVGNDRNWGNILGRIKTEIGRRGKNWNEKELFQESYALLDSVKDAWRNATMHIDKKYTADEAHHIFNMIKGFMSKIASRMDENGMPVA